MKSFLTALLLAFHSYAGEINVFFSPDGGCTDAVVAELGKAKRTVLVQAYSFTSAPIAKALVNAHKRSVNVQVILDKSQRKEKYTEADFLLHAGVATFIDDRHAIAHNKIMVIDGSTVLTGSFNFRPWITTAIDPEWRRDSWTAAFSGCALCLRTARPRTRRT